MARYYSKSSVTIVIIGASGFLGSKLFTEYCSRFSVVGTYKSRKHDGLEHLDVANQRQVSLFFKKLKPNLIIHCGGMTRPDECEINRDMAWMANVIGTRNIVQNSGCKILYFSTDYVFNGTRGAYNEYDLPNPINYYGITKREAEKVVMAASGDNVVLRVSGIYGYNEINNDFISSLSSMKRIKAATDCISSYTLVDDIASSLPDFFDKAGIFHLAGPFPISRYDFARMAVQFLALPTTVEPVPSEAIYIIAKRPRNSSLVTVRHNIRLASPMEGLTRLREQMNTERYQGS